MADEENKEAELQPNKTEEVNDNDVDDNTAVTFTDQVIAGMLVQCADHDGVNVGVNMGSNVHVMNNGELQVITPVTTFTPGFKVDPGGKLSVFSESLPN